MKKNFILALGLSLAATFSTQAQVVGGRENSDMTPKAVGPEKLSGGTFSGDVNLFTGDYNATQPLGTVSTPGGLSYTLKYTYSATYTSGGSTPSVDGIPYGDGWSLNIPTISVESDVFNNFLKAHYCEENSSFYSESSNLINFNNPGVEASKEGDVYWFSPVIDIPGVVSGRAVFKYVDVSDSKAIVFALNSFDSPVEIRYYGDHWIIILADGTRYHFKTTLISSRAPVNARTLFYDQTNINTADVNEPLEQDLENTLDVSVQNAIFPKRTYTSWYCDLITHNNLASQTISFLYEKYGEFNYFKEFLQPQLIFGIRELTDDIHSADQYDFKAYSDILLTKVSSFAPDIPVEELRLTYKTDFHVLNSTTQFINFRLNGASRLDSLYSMKIINSATGTTDFTGWKRYKHVKQTQISTELFGSNTNPYLAASGYLRESVTPDDEIAFNHGFLESSRIGQHELFPGDIYEIRTKIRRLENTSIVSGNGTFDIAVVTGNNHSSQLDPDGNPFSYLDNNSGGVYSEIDYNKTRNIELFSTFNMAVKWHLGYGEGSKQTSNFFMMPNTPQAFQGINIQIGGGNSDNDFSADMSGEDYMFLTENGQANAKLTYAHRQNLNAYPLKSASPVPHSFGVGLPWGTTIPLYEKILTSNSPESIDPNSEEESFNFWWANPTSTFSHQPTKADNQTYLDEFELIRYAKNPFMLQKVELYRLNGEVGTANDAGWKLISSKALEYETELSQVVENFVYNQGDSLIYKPLIKQVHILLKVIRDLPVDYYGDTLKSNATFLTYSQFRPQHVKFFDEYSYYDGNKKWVLTGIQDHLGGITQIGYYDFTDPQTYFTLRYDKQENCLNGNTREDFGTYRVSTIHPVVHFISKNDENNLVSASAVSDDPAVKHWEYVFDPASRKGIASDFKLWEDHFRSRYLSPYKTGFGNVTVKSPQLEGGEFTYSVYEHYTHDHQTITLDNHLLFGKLKSTRTYNDLNQLHEEKLFNYSYTLAFQNGYLRPNYYREHLNYEEKDYNRVIHPYEYEDYYTNELTSAEITVTNPQDSSIHHLVIEEGVEAYPYLDIPLLKGLPGLFETPRYLEFEYYPMLIASNPDYLFNSYFVKLSEEINRVYDNYLSKAPTAVNPKGPGVVVPDNPQGPGKPNLITMPGDQVHLGNILMNASNLTNKLISGSPLSETVLTNVLATANLTFEQKAKVLKAQNGLSNLIWENVLNLERNFTPHQLKGLIDAQAYFSDQVQQAMLLKNHPDFDRKVFEAMMLKNSSLSNTVMESMMPSTETAIYMNSKSFMEIFTRQEHLTENLLVSIVNHPYLIPGLLPELLQNQNTTSPVYEQIINNPAIEGQDIATIIEQDPVYPDEEILLLLLDQREDLSVDVIKRVVAAANRTLEESVINKINELPIPQGKHPEIVALAPDINPLSRFCPNPELKNRIYLESKTTYEYYDANYKGVTDGAAYRTLLAINDIPGRTIDLDIFFSVPVGQEDTRVIDKLYLKHEPSWQLFSKTVTSPHLPGMYSEEQYFYAYDLKNRYDRHWFNYDIVQENHLSDVSIVDLDTDPDDLIELIDTIGFNIFWHPDYAYESNGDLPRFDAMVYSQQNDMRSTVFQKTNFSKNQHDQQPVMKSEYFHYDARWDIDATPNYNYSIPYEGPECEEEEEEEDPPTPCETCIYEKFISDEGVAINLLPLNYCLWEGQFFGYYMCPSSFTVNPCVSSATKVVCNPVDGTEGGDDGPNQYIILSTLLNKSLQLKRSYVQLDTIPLASFAGTDHLKMDKGNSYIAEFRAGSKISEDAEGFKLDYDIALPFDNLQTSEIIDRNRYLQPELVQNQTGVQTKYYYEKPEMRRYVNDSCPGPESNMHRTYAANIGQPLRITLGYDRADSMTTVYQYNTNGLISSVIQPSGHTMSYTYDGFFRLKEVMENGSRLLSRTGYSQWGHNFSHNFQQRTAQNYISSILYNNYVNDGTIVDTNQRELMRAYIDPLGREHSVTRNYGNQYLYSGTAVYDNWSRVTQSHKPVAETLIGGSLTLKDNILMPFAENRYENTPKNRLVRASDFDVPIGDPHTRKADYLFVNNVFLACELALSTAELRLLAENGNTSNFLFIRSSKLDQDNKEIIEYSNAFGQKIASLAYDDNMQKIVTLFGYDSYGNLTKVINPEKQVSDYEYNMLGLLVKEKTVDSGEKRYMYNKHFKVSAIQDQLHRSRMVEIDDVNYKKPLVRKFEYDVYGRLVRQYVKNTSAIYDIYAYQNTLISDGNGNPTVIDGSEVYFEYDYSYKSSLDWMYVYSYWNGVQTSSGGPGANTEVTPSSSGIGTIPDENNVPPRAVDDLGGFAYAGQLASINVLANDSDPEDELNPNSVDLNIELPGIQHQYITEQGIWTADQDEVVYFLPGEDFSGETEILYTVDDEDGASSNEALIRFLVDNPGAVNLPEKTWAYGLDGTQTTVGKLLSATSYSNEGLPIQKTDYTYNTEDRVAGQAVHFHPVSIEAAGNAHIRSKISYPAYNFRGSLLEEKIDADNNGVVDLHYFYTYDALNRLTEVYAAKAEVADKSLATLMASYSYDDATGLLKKEKHLNGASVTAQEIQYLYDVRDRLTRLNGQLLRYELFYDENLPPAYGDEQVVSSMNYNGNINGIQATYKFAATTNAPSNFDLPTIYGYRYDKMNRLLGADAIVGDFVADATVLQLQSSYLIGDESYSYDRIGNLKTLQRYFKSQLPNVMAQIEGYNYKYHAGSNKLQTAQGIPGTANRGYRYDVNGNMTEDLFKNLIITQYGRAAYAYELTKGTENISYLYDVNDLRIYKTATDNGISKTEYYLKDAMNRDVAIYNVTSSSWTYHVHGTQLLARINPINTNAAVNLREGTFYLYDHLGNTRVTYQPESVEIVSILDENNNPVYVNRTVNKIMYSGDYFPYGKVLREYSEGSIERYLTTFHERDQETGLDYRGARYYDSDIARFLSTDPLQTQYPEWSTYNYVMGNPIAFVDPTGKGVDDPSPIGPGLRMVHFAATHPIAAIRIGYGVTKGSSDISTTATRFATRGEVLAGSVNGQREQGSENGAFRHTLWQAAITSEFGKDIATLAGNAHEFDPFVDLKVRSFDNLNEADQTVDLLNNIIGRSIGAKNSGASTDDLANLVLDEFKNNGLFTATKDDKSGNWNISRTKLSSEKYNKLDKIFEGLDALGRKTEERK